MAASTHFLILILVFLVQLLLALANIEIGSTLLTNGNKRWVSASSEFAFGFHQINGTSTSTFILAIWYNQIPDKTIIWHAVKTPNNDKDPVEAPQGSQLGLTAQGLILTNPQNESIWTAQPTNNNGVIVSSAAMLDSGNFVLVDAESNNVWESFQNPTDTLLPSQSLQPSATLTSRLTQTNFTIGRFQLYFKDGNVLLSPLAWPSTNRYKSYYQIDASGNASRLAFDNTTGNIYVVATDGTELQTPQDTTWQKNIAYDPTSYYYRVTLEYHGVLTQYSHPRDSRSNGWSIKRYVPDDICTAIFNETGSGACGYNSYCSMENQIPTCTCPQGFSLVDQSNQYAGCQSSFTFLCGADGAGSQQELYQLPESASINFPLGDYAILAPYSQQECQQSCLQDCMCGVVVYNADEKTCWKKSLPLINGIKQDNNRLALIFVKRTNYHQDDCDKAKTVFIGSLIGSLLVNSVLIASVVFFILLLKSKSGVSENNLRSFTYQELEQATNGFSDNKILGRGSFGIVYKGTLESSLVAVKKLIELKEEGGTDVNFKIELTAIAKLYHRNLVRLIGYCNEKSHRILVYEFMSKGTLRQVLFAKDKPKPLWSARVGFTLGIARGLVYLHEECEAPVMHCDIKPDNVLIDEHLNAKISDFGLAKLLSRNKSTTETVKRGTPGYKAPEWEQDVPNPEVTTKVDVYSFGVVLLEIICCAKNVLPRESKERKDAILDPSYMKVIIDYLMRSDEEAMSYSGRVKKWVEIAMMCIQENPTDRPTMKMAMQMLEEDVNQVVTDPPPPLSVN